MIKTIISTSYTGQTLRIKLKELHVLMYINIMLCKQKDFKSSLSI